MHADFSVELGRDDAALELPWSSADPAVRYYDLKNHPELLQQVPEAMAHPELGAFLARINAAGFPLATAKCDAWASRKVTPEEEIFGDRKFVSYIDLVFEDAAARRSFEKHEAFAKDLCRLLSQAPEIPAAVELVVRRCYYHAEGAFLAAADDTEAGEASGVSIATKTATHDAGAGKFGAGGRGEVEEIDGEGMRAEAGSGDIAEHSGASNREGEAEQQSGPANREGADRVAASERSEQQADVGHGMKYGGHADVGEREEPEIEKAEAERLDMVAADERIRLSDPDESVGGFCFTTYVTGFGDSDHEPRLRWQIALALLQNALVQLARD